MHDLAKDQSPESRSHLQLLVLLIPNSQIAKVIHAHGPRWGVFAIRCAKAIGRTVDGPPWEMKLGYAKTRKLPIGRPAVDQLSSETTSFDWLPCANPTLPKITPETPILKLGLWLFRSVVHATWSARKSIDFKAFLVYSRATVLRSRRPG